MSGAVIGAIPALLMAAHATAPFVAPTTSPIVFGQIFDGKITNPAAMTGTRAFVWSDDHKMTGFGRVPGVILGEYTPGYRASFYYDPPGGTEWFYVHHPDWITYQADRTTIAYGFGDRRFTPLDVTNPKVLAFKVAEVMGINKRQTWADLDNISLQNPSHVAGHYAGVRAPCAPADRPACGGVWVRQFTGAPSDRAWIAATRSYIAAITAAFHAVGMKVMINNVENSPTISSKDHIALSALADGTLVEGFPIDGCGHWTGWIDGRPVDGQFDADFENAAAESSRPFFAAAYLCAGDIRTVSNDDAAWATAAMLIVERNPPVDYLSLTPETMADFLSYPASMSPKVGTAIEPPPRPGSRPYVRRYAGGIAALNASSTQSHVFTVPPGPHTDQFGAPVASGPLTLAPHSAIVILGPPY